MLLYTSNSHLVEGILSLNGQLVVLMALVSMATDSIHQQREASDSLHGQEEEGCHGQTLYLRQPLEPDQSFLK